MSIPNRDGIQRRPTHPGEMLREDFLPEYGLTTAELAKAVRVSRQTINGKHSGGTLKFRKIFKKA